MVSGIEINKIVQLIKRINKPINMTVSGISMIPVIYENDIITVQPSVNYNIGDIVVFFYKGGELLAHRLLYIKGNEYFCKGDNAFRIEKIKKEDIVGKIISLKRNSEAIEIPAFRDDHIVFF